MKKDVIKTLHIGNLIIKYKKRPRGFLGRFGGGWNWKIGIQGGGKTVILSLLVFSLVFNWINKIGENQDENT